jgi:hypothetical protein
VFMSSKLQFLALLSVCGAALAAAPTAEDIRHCSAIADSAARLACFDQLSSAPAAAPAAKKGPVAAPVAPVVVAPAAPASAAPATGSFGAEAVPKSAEEKAAAASLPTSITAHVTAVLPTQGNMYRITLDNGQVWQTEEGRSVFTVKVGDTVQVDKRSMGSYQLAVMVSGKESYPVRARRQK